MNLAQKDPNLSINDPYDDGDILRNTPLEFVNDVHPIIRVIGVGGAGCNAVNHMHTLGIENVSLVVCNTDAQQVKDSPVKDRLIIGEDGLGAGIDMSEGTKAAEAARDKIKAALNYPHTKMLFIAAGMGGGTGTGAAPVIAQIARELGILTVAIVTYPFNYEGVVKIKQAEDGIHLLKEYCDTVLVVLNQKLLVQCPDMDIEQAFAEADSIIAKSAKNIAEIITKSGKVNADFKDVRKILKDAKQAVMGYEICSGEDRALKAVEGALHSPLLDSQDISNARRILATVGYSSQKKVKVLEQEVITDYINQRIGKRSADYFKLAYVPDETLGEALRFTIIAAEFNTEEVPVPTVPKPTPGQKPGDTPTIPDVPTAPPAVASVWSEELKKLIREKTDELSKSFKMGDLNWINVVEKYTKPAFERLETPLLNVNQLSDPNIEKVYF
jgi:cell division protein FtsZ